MLFDGSGEIFDMLRSLPSSPRALGIILCLLVTVVYGTLAAAYRNREPEGDELRYMEYAVNLTKGYYVTDAHPHFINTPGYPLLLMPFAKGGLMALFVARLLNVLLMAIATSLFFHLARRYLPPLFAAGITLISVFHPTLAGEVPLLMSEAMSFVLLTAFLTCYTHSLNTADAQRWRWVLLATLAFGALVMTRVIFGYVAMALLGFSVLGFLLHRTWRQAWLSTGIICAGTLILCIPYLSYTKAKTGKTMCWTTTGAEMFYWMTSSQPGENGYWFSHDTVLERPELAVHRGLYVEVCQSKSPANEHRLMERVSEQFKANPMGFVHNWLCNWPRMFFGFPRSFEYENLTRVVLIVWNGPLLLAMLASFMLGWRRWLAAPPEIGLLLLFAAVFTGGSSMAPALPRYLVIMIPVLWLCATVMLSRHVKLRVE